MRARTVLFTLGVLAAGPASAADAHVVVPGETLSGIAAANGLSTASLAAANGIPADAFVISGQTLNVPPPQATPAPAPAEAAPAPQATPGGTFVQPGDTLSAIAARMGTTPAALAAANGITDPNVILAGTTLRPASATPAPATAPAQAAQAAGPEGAPAATGVGAAPTAERMSGGDISQIAATNGAPGDLAAAIAWQESGFNNALTSSAGARGIMQIMPGTWDWIDRTLARPPLNRASATDNVRAGSLFLGQLLKETGGDVPTAVAGYYQGLGSVRRNGMLPETRRYVDNVLALRGRTG